MANDPPMVFSDEWGRLIHSAINASADYRLAAADWRDSLGLEMEGAAPGAPSAAVLDLRDGSCRAVDTGPAARPGEAAFQLSASRADWQELLAGRLEPMWGIMSGRLRLERGSLAALLPFAEAARHLVAAIASVDAIFPARDRQEKAR